MQRELGSRPAAFAPPGERPLGLFEAAYGDTQPLDPTGTPIDILLTNGIAQAWMKARMQHGQGRIYHLQQLGGHPRQGPYPQQGSGCRRARGRPRQGP